MIDIEERLAAITKVNAKLLLALVEELVAERVETRVRDRLGELLGQLEAPPPPPRKTKPSGARRAVKPGRVVRDKPRPDGKTKCGKCGRTGHNARTCPKAGAADDEDEPAPLIATLIERSSIGRGLKNIRENGIDAELADLDRELHPRRKLKAMPDGTLKALNTTTVAIASSPSCPHGAGSPASCSQCVLGAAKVTRAEIIGGNVVVDGVVVRSTREHTAAANESINGGRSRQGASKRRCLRCGQPNHNARTCKSEPADVDVDEAA